MDDLRGSARQGQKSGGSRSRPAYGECTFQNLHITVSSNLAQSHGRCCQSILYVMARRTILQDPEIPTIGTLPGHYSEMCPLMP